MTIRERCLDVLPVLAAGVLAFLLYAHTAVLNPFNVTWLLHHDSAMHLYGILYFIRDPWAMPLGRLFSYGEGFATSVVYTDSIPLLAITIKALATVTNSAPVFQPFGWWFLLCFILQAWFSFRLARLFIAERSTCVLVAFMACLSPPFLVRGGAHEALMAHWLIIWALTLSLDDNRRGKALTVSWPLLLMVSLGIHAYIFFMCGALWVAANLQVLAVRSRPSRNVAWCAGGAISSVLIFAYLYGYFMPVQKVRWGYEMYKMNLLAPLNPMGWSIVLPSARDAATGGEYEGFSYFGLGVLIIVLAASLTGCSDRTLWFRRKSLLSVLVVGTAIALTPYLNIGVLRRRTSLAVLVGIALVLAFGLLPTGSVPGAGALRRHLWRPIISLTALLVGAGLMAVIFVPLIPVEVLGLVRASGRLFWPTWYFYFFLSCVMVARALAWRRVCLLLLGCALVQIVDISPGLARLNRSQFSVGGPAENVLIVSRELTDTLEAALGGKRHLSILGQAPLPHGWEQLAMLALRGHAGIDKAYYARPPLAYEGAAAARLQAVEDGVFREDTVYLAYSEYRERVSRAVARFGGAFKSAEVDCYLVVWSER